MNKKDLYKNRWLGMKIVTIGIAIVFITFLSSYYLSSIFSTSLFIIGFITAIIGTAIHMKQFYKEITADPKEINKIVKNPWE